MIRSAVSSLSGAVVSPLRLASSSSRCSPSSSCRSSSVATFSTTTHSQKARAVIGYSLPFHVPKPASAPKTLSTLGSPSPKSAEVIYNKHPGPSFGLQTPKDFLDAISYPPRRILSENSELVGAIGESWDEMFHVDGPKLRKAGVEPKVRKYFLWAIEKYRQGQNPAVFRIKPKPKKIVRGWGPRVQNGYRVSGVRRPGEKVP